MESKKAYEKPEIKKVALVSDEAVLSNCKSSVTPSAGPGADDCTATACKEFGLLS